MVAGLDEEAYHAFLALLTYFTYFTTGLVMSVVAGLEEEAASCYEATLELFADLQQVSRLTYSRFQG